MADVHARSGTKTPKPRPEIKKMKRLTRSLVPKPIRFRYQQSAKQTFLPSHGVRSADHRRVNESPIPRLSRKTKTIRLALASNEKAFRALDAKLLLFAMAKP
jgi:hypothetical protein